MREPKENKFVQLELLQPTISAHHLLRKHSFGWSTLQEKLMTLSQYEEVQ